MFVLFGQQKVAKLKLVNWAEPRVASVMRWPKNGGNGSNGKVCQLQKLLKFKNSSLV